MRVSYTEWKTETSVVDTDEFWMKWLNDGALKADSYWHDCWDNNEPYCYGRNDVYLNLFYAETGNRRQVYSQTIIQPEVWNIPNGAYARLLGDML